MRHVPLLALLLLAGCPHAAPVAEPPPPPPLPRIPAHCELPLAGSYHHRDDATFAFELTDDGTTVHATAFRRFGQTRQPIASTASQIALRRTPQGFRGESHAQQEVIPGALSCPVVFPYEVTACTAEGITLRGLPAMDVKVERAPLLDGGFTLACGGAFAPTGGFTENVLVRDGADAGPAPLDAGAVSMPADAGPADAGPGDAGASAVAPPDAGPENDAGAAPGDAGAADRRDAGVVEA